MKTPSRRSSVIEEVHSCSGWLAQGQSGNSWISNPELTLEQRQHLSFTLALARDRFVVQTAPAVLLMRHLLESHFLSQKCFWLDVGPYLPSCVAFRCCSYTYQSHFPLRFQSDSPVLSKQEETLLKSSITFLFSSSIPAQTRGDNTKSFKYLIYKEKSLLKRDQLMHF